MITALRQAQGERVRFQCTPFKTAQNARHCERSEAISSYRHVATIAGDCFVATLLAMTESLFGVRLEQLVQMDDDIFHLGIFDGQLRRGAPSLFRSEERSVGK